MTQGQTEVLAEIQRIAAAELNLPRPIDLGDQLVADLKLDSLELTTLAVALEDRFQIRLREEDSTQVSTVGDLVRLVARRTEERGE